MALELYLHPLSSYCHKVLIAFYENDVPFEPKLVDDPAVFAELQSLWPLARFPVLRDSSRSVTLPESSIIIEYLARHFPGPAKLIPDDPDRALHVRLVDRFFDNYLHTPMQKFAFDRNRPPDKRDAYGVDEAKALYRRGLDRFESEMTAGRRWAAGDDFTLADCSAAPALFYGDRFYGPFRQSHPAAMSYLDRLKARPSYARALREAEPYMHMLPS
ncbi:MAG TPA: glutathione S-transferase family protein [Steroidobacteraceae bacterium]|nr:glutathione S-transferase family protein [Steroidobacteraceae bacterium]